MNKILQNKPLAQYLSLRREIDLAISEVLQSGSYILADQVENFEYEFAKYIDCKFGVGVANATDALIISLKALGVRAGDEVITVSHTAIATVAAIIAVGARPVLIDVNLESYTMDHHLLESAITSKTAAIIPVHIYGHGAEILEIKRIAGENKIPVIEDASQAHGATLDNRKLGSFGEISVFSFYPTKNLGALGDAGFIGTNNEELFSRMKLIRQYGWKTRNNAVDVGLNSRMDEIQAAILRVKLKYIDENNFKRNKIAEIYNQELIDLNLKLPNVKLKYSHVYHQYVILTSLRDELRDYLLEKEIETSIHYEVPIHNQQGYLNELGKVHSMPNTEVISKNGLSLPMYPELSNVEVLRVTDSIREFFLNNEKNN